MKEKTVDASAISVSKNNRNDVLKLIAIITMLLDHIGYMFFPKTVIFRAIGRIAFPIFAYHIALGYRHTSNLKRYAKRLFVFALISQVPYTLMSFFASGNNAYNPIQFNVMFLLLTGLLVLRLYDDLRASYDVSAFSFNTLLNLVLLLIVIVMPRILTYLLKDISIYSLDAMYDFTFSYGSYGLVLILIFYMFPNSFYKALIAFLLLSFISAHVDYAVLELDLPSGIDSLSKLGLLCDSIFGFSSISSRLYGFWARFAALRYPFFQMLSVFGVIIIYALKNKKFAFRMPSWFAYWFYPVHLAILGIIDFFISTSSL